MLGLPHLSSEHGAGAGKGYPASSEVTHHSCRAAGGAENNTADSEAHNDAPVAVACPRCKREYAQLPIHAADVVIRQPAHVRVYVADCRDHPIRDDDVVPLACRIYQGDDDGTCAMVWLS